MWSFILRRLLYSIPIYLGIILLVMAALRVNGTVKGDVRATQRVELGPKARVIGNVQYKLIEMSIGAEVNGKLIHESEQAAAKSVSRPQVDTTRPVSAGE